MISLSRLLKQDSGATELVSSDDEKEASFLKPQNQQRRSWLSISEKPKFGDNQSIAKMQSKKEEKQTKEAKNDFNENNCTKEKVQVETNIVVEGKLPSAPDGDAKVPWWSKIAQSASATKKKIKIRQLKKNGDFLQLSDDEHNTSEDESRNKEDRDNLGIPGNQKQQSLTSLNGSSPPQNTPESEILQLSIPQTNSRNLAVSEKSEGKTSPKILIKQMASKIENSATANIFPEFQQATAQATVASKEYAEKCLTSVQETVKRVSPRLSRRCGQDNHRTPLTNDHDEVEEMSCNARDRLVIT